MKLCGVLFTTLLTCCVAVENFNPAVPVAHRLSSRIKRQSTGGDPNLEGIFGVQNNGNVNPSQSNNNGGNNGQFGQSSSPGSNEQPQFGFGFSGLEQTSSNNNNNNGGFGGFDNSGNQGSSNNGGFNNQGSNQWSSGNNGGFGSSQGSFGSGSNAQNVQRPRTTQRTPLNQIALQTTISDTDCLRNCRNRVPQQYAPICGSDNISYTNRQVFDCYKRECRQDVKIVYAGSCVTTRAPQ